MGDRSRKSTRRSSRANSEDYSVYVHRDFVSSKSMQFAIRNYAEAGALTDVQIMKLALDHDLPLDSARTLSQEVGFALDVDTNANLVKISRSVVERRLDNPPRRHRPVRNRLSVSQANALFKSLSLPVRVREDDENVASGGIKVVDIDTARRALEPDDRRAERDSRRLLVVECCCYLALDLGWPSSFTTDATRTREVRTGKLLELARDVIEMTSVTGERVSVDTLARDIDLVRKRLRIRGDLPAD